MDMYRQVTTGTRVEGKTTRRIKINAGVKQSCPLSPLLFNIVIDELLERTEQTRIGVKYLITLDTLINVMAFADDLVLIGEKPGNMKILLQMCEKLFDEKGLSVNTTKCASLKVLPVKGKKAMKVITEIHRHWKGQPNPNINFEKLGKYLRLHINHTRKVELPRKLWKLYFERIKKLCLNGLPENKSRQGNDVVKYIKCVYSTMD